MFSNNIASALSLGADPKNGNDAAFYTGTSARQDIYLAGYSGTTAESLVVTGDIDVDTIGQGSITVWAAQDPHFVQNRQFAVMSGGTYTGLDAFRNARDDETTRNPLKNEPGTPLYLYGIPRDGLVYWSGSMDLIISKEITGDFADLTAIFPFTVTVTGLPVGYRCDYDTYTFDGTDWNYESSGVLTATLTAAPDTYTLQAFSLRHHQKIVISIPRGLTATVTEEPGIGRASYVIGGGASVTGSSTGSIALNEDTFVAFTNHFAAVAPTGLRYRETPYILLAGFGLLLALINTKIHRRRRRDGPDTGVPARADVGWEAGGRPPERPPDSRGEARAGPLPRFAGAPPDTGQRMTAAPPDRFEQNHLQKRNKNKSNIIAFERSRKSMKNLKKLGALVMVLAMIFALGATAYATGTEPATLTNGIYGTVSGNAVTSTINESVKIQKDLTVFNENETAVSAPTIAYTYYITPGTASKRVTDGNGVAVLTKTGVLTGMTATGSANGTQSAANTATSTQLYAVISWDTNANVTAADDGAANTQYLFLDFSGVNFGAAGVYRYKIQETLTSGTYADRGVTDGDTANSHLRYLDVYVKDAGTAGTGAAAWDVYGYALFTNDNDIDGRSTATESTVDAAAKTTGFLGDKYYTYNVTVGKTLLQDVAMNEHDFPFTVNFTNNSVTQTVRILKTTSENGAAAVSATALTGTLSTGIQDQPGIDHNSSVKYIGVPVGVTTGTTTSVFEKNDVAGTTYNSSYQIDGAEAAGTKSISWDTTGDANKSNVATFTVTQDEDDETSHTVQFTNTMLLISPTGVVLRVAPYVLMFGVGLLLIVMSRRKREGEA